MHLAALDQVLNEKCSLKLFAVFAGVADGALTRCESSLADLTLCNGGFSSPDSLAHHRRLERLLNLFMANHRFM